MLVRARRALGCSGLYGLPGLPGPSLWGERCALSSLLERSRLASLITCRAGACLVTLP